MSNHSGKHNHGNHMWMMLICCLAPVLLVFFLGKGIGDAGGAESGGFLSLLPALLCPLMMLPMMIGMFKKNDQPQGQDGNAGENQKGSCH